MLSSKGFIVLCFTLKSMIYFELISMNGARSASRFIFQHMDVQLEHHLLKGISLPHVTHTHIYLLESDLFQPYQNQGVYKDI